MNKQILSEEFKRMQKLAGIINEINMTANKYLYQDFELKHYGDDLYEELFKKLFDKNNKFEIDGKKIWLDPEVEGDWEKIIGMDVKQLEDTYSLTLDMAKKVKDEFDKNIK